MLVMIHITNVFLLLLIFINLLHAFDAHYIHCRSCNVMRSCLIVTHELLHVQAMTRVSFLEYKSATKFPLIIPKRKDLPTQNSKIDFYKFTEHSPRFYLEFEYKYIHYSMFEKEFLQVVRVEKTIFRGEQSIARLDVF